MKTLSVIDQILRRATDSGAIPGVVAAVATGEGMIYNQACGRRSLAGDAAMTTDTVCWFASMTKAVTATAAMQLVERGKLSLDAPAAKILPEIGRAQVMEGFDASGKPRLRPAKGEVTLRQLLTHTSGFAYEIWNADAARELEVRGAGNILTGTRATFERPLLADPGTRWEYDPGIDFAGRMVEEASGQRLGEFMRANLFQPLGMQDTGFRVRPDQAQRLAGVHARMPDGSLVPYPFELPQDPEVEMGGHALLGTASDYLRFQRMILGGGALDGTRVLEAKTVAAMSQNQMGELNVQAMPASLPFSNAVEFYPGIPCKWGLSFMINTRPTPQGRSAGSLAWAGLANSYYWIDPTRRVAGILIAQILPFYDAAVVGLFQEFESAVYRELQ
jgi:CubicO group peptidase (beta-lactamase class C family)